jgi:hypothetical protein
MYIARWFIIFGLILVALVAYHPATQGQVQATLEHVRPVMVTLMDGLYSMVRTLVTGEGQHKQIDDQPVSPGFDFDRIVTMDTSSVT